MIPYYQDDAVTLYRGRCEDVLPILEVAGSVHLLTDPPYFKVKGEAWDNQWDKASEFLDWLGGVLDLVKPILSANASVWVFTSPRLNTAVESVVASRFRVLNNVRWVKEQGWHQKADIGQARRFLTAWEGIVFAEQTATEYEDSAKALHKDVYAPLGRYLQTERERAGISRSDLEVRLGYVSKTDPTRGTALAYRWEEGSSLPTAEAYAAMRGVLGEGFLRREYEDLRREHEDLRRPFNSTDRQLLSDTWTFDTVPPYKGKHPCEKPQALLRHMIETTTRPGDTIIDPFAGSGSVLQAARDLGRKAIGIEMDEKWCAHAVKKLTQQAFDFGSIEEVRAAGWASPELAI